MVSDLYFKNVRLTFEYRVDGRMIWAARSDFRGEVSLDTETLHERTLEMAGRERRKRIKEKESKIDDYKTRVYDPAFGVRWL